MSRRRALLMPRALACGLAVLLLSLAGRVSDAATLRVPFDHETIAAAVAAAESGDVISLAAGDHVVDEPIRIEGLELRIESEAGPAATRIVDNARMVPLDDFVFDVRSTGQGFSLSGIQVLSNNPDGLGNAKGLLLVNGPGTVRVQDCWFEGIALPPQRDIIRLQGVTAAEMAELRITGNSGFRSLLRVEQSANGGRRIPASLSTSVIEGNISNPTAALVQVANRVDLDLMESSFRKNLHLSPLLAVYGESRLTARQVSLVENKGRINGRLVLVDASSTCHLERSTLAFNSSFDHWHLFDSILMENDDPPEVVLDHSIVWGNTVPPERASTVRLVARNCCIDVLDLSVDTDNLRENPRFCGWRGPGEYWLDAAFEGESDGTQAAPFNSFQRVAETVAYETRLAADSPCLGGGRGGVDIGATTAICPPEERVAVLTLHLAAGDYFGEVEFLQKGVRLLGAGFGRTRIQGELGVLGDASLVRDLSIVPSVFTTDLQNAAMVVAAGRVEIDRCRVVSGFEVGCRNLGGQLDIRRSEFSDLRDAAVWSTGGRVALESCTIDTCSKAGIVSEDSDLDLRNCRIERNGFRSDRSFSDARCPQSVGGGVFVCGEPDSVRLQDCRLYRNYSSPSGGGVSLFLDGDTSVEILDCVFDGNSAGESGGALRVEATGDGNPNGVPDVLVRASRIVRSFAGNAGAAADIARGRVRFDHVTVAHNVALDGTVLQLRESGRASFDSCIVWEEAGAIPWRATLLPPTAEFSCIFGSEPVPGVGNISIAPGWCPWEGRDRVHIDVRAALPGDGSLQAPYRSVREALQREFTLTISSPCLGTGRNGSDMGAPSSVTFAACSPPTTIQLATGEYEGWALSLPAGVTLRGQGAEDTVLEGPLLIDSGESSGLRDLRIQTLAQRSGLIVGSGARVALEDCRIERCFEGAVRVLQSAQVELRFSDITQCQGVLPGTALRLEPAASATLDRCRVDRNFSHSTGGAFFVDQGARLDVQSSELVLNQATTDGSILHAVDATVSLTNCLVLTSRRLGTPETTLHLEGGQTNLLHVTAWELDMSPVPAIRMNASARLQVTNSVLWSRWPIEFFTPADLDMGRVGFGGSIALLPAGREIAGVLVEDPLLRNPDFPDFIEASAVDYRLAWNSPAIDLGDAEAAPDSDLLGITRPCFAGPDAGAYEFCEAREPPRAFIRGDVDQDGRVILTDAVSILDYLFLRQASPSCLLSADVDDNERVELTDAVRILDYLFLQGVPPVAPFPDCGTTPRSTSTACRESNFCAG